MLAAGSLAVGSGLAAALASVADAVLFRPLPVARPGEIVRVYTASRLQPLGYVSYPDYQDLSRNSRTLAGMVAQSQVLLALGAGVRESPQVRMGLAVTPNYFDVLGVRAELGRDVSRGRCAHGSGGAEQRVLALPLRWRSPDYRPRGRDRRSAFHGRRCSPAWIRARSFRTGGLLHSDRSLQNWPPAQRRQSAHRSSQAISFCIREACRAHPRGSG
jgi:hypothetical protein